MYYPLISILFPKTFGDSMINKKKLIEVALPLDAINKASAREKSIRHGHPSKLHLWWDRDAREAAERPCNYAFLSFS